MTKPKEKSKQSYTAHFEGNPVFCGVHWDAKSLESVNTVARALLNLTELFKAQDVRIDTMVRVGPREICDDSVGAVDSKKRGIE